jgi:hypothetical protein
VAKNGYEKYYHELKAIDKKYEESEKTRLSNLENIEDDLSKKLEKAAREKEKMTEQLAEAREEA